MATFSVVTRSSSDQEIIYLRIHHKDTTRYLSLGVKLDPADWNENRSEVRKSNPHHRRINGHISEVRSVAEEVVHEFQTSTNLLTTADRLKERIRVRLESDGDQDEEFFEYAEDLLEGYKARGQHGTHKNYRSVVNKFRRFIRAEKGRERLRFEEITVRLLRGFRTWCASELDNRPNTVQKALSILRTFVYSAIKEGLMDQGDNPFFHMELSREKVQKPILTLEEVRRVEQLELTGFKAEVRDWWMFSFYAGGLRFSDLAKLQYRNLTEEDGVWRISYEMTKTGERKTNRLPEPAVEIVKQMRSGDAAPGDRVLSILEGYGELTEEEDLRRAIESRNARANLKLKEIAKAAEIEKNLTMHTARRSVASHMLDKDWTVYEIKEALGHSDVTVTEAYLKRLDRSDMDEKWEELF